jgi:adenylosuccinate synthase
LQGKSVGQKLDEKEYGLEVGRKRVWIRGWMEKKIYRKAIVLEGKEYG